MKKLIILALGVSISWFACKNSDDSTTSKDTASKQTAETTAPKDTSANQNALMESMNTMMQRMQGVQMSGDFDIDFANMMIQHHQGALDMAQIELSQGKDEKMKSKAQEILTNQKDEQQKLRDFVKTYKPSGMKHGEGELQKAMTSSRSKMKSIQMNGNIDKDFAMMMAEHHEDGIVMANLEIKNGMSEKLKEMAKTSVADQQRDIAEFKSWLSKQ